MSEDIRDKRINKPSDVRVLMQEQINILRKDTTLDPINKARVIASLSNTALSAFQQGELLEKVTELEVMLNERFD